MSLSEQLSGALHEERSVKTVKMDDELLLATAKEMVAADPKNRFNPRGIRAHLAKKMGVDLVKLVDSSGGRYSEVRETERLTTVKDPAIMDDRARGFYKFRKTTAKKSGLSFQKLGRDETDVLYDGEPVGIIERQFGLIPGAATRESEWTYDVVLWADDLKKLGIETRGANPSKNGLRGIRDAKKFAKDFFKKNS